MMGVYEAITVGLTWGLAISSFFSYLAACRAVRSTEEIFSHHRKSMDALFADIIEGIRVNGQDTRKQIEQHAGKTIRNMNKEVEDSE